MAANRTSIRIFHFLALLAFLGLFSQSAHAIPWVDPDIYDQGPAIYVGYWSGGDTLNGDFNAGDGMSFHVGFHNRFKTGIGHTNLQLSIGYRTNEANGEDGVGQPVTGSMFMFPIEFLGHFQMGGFNIGGGLAYHLLPVYSEKGLGVNRTIDFNSQLGFVLSAEFVAKKIFMAGIRYNIVEYTPTDGPFARSDTGQIVSKVDGSSVSFYIGLYLM